MRRGALATAVLAIASMIVIASPLVLVVEAQESPDPELGRRWLTRIDSWNGIPEELALRYGEAALAAGLTKGEAARLLNDFRFVAAVGAPDQGWGLLEAMAENPVSIANAWNLLRDGGDELTSAGATSFQYALMLEYPELRNPYLADLGHMIAVRPDGVEVLVDIETGRQVLDEDTLGGQVTAPGGGPLPTPSISPDEAAAQMWEDAGIDPNDPNPNPGEIRELAGRNVPTGPGSFGLRDEHPPQTLFTPAVYIILGAFALTWVGYAVVMLLKRVRRA